MRFLLVFATAVIASAQILPNQATGLFSASTITGVSSSDDASPITAKERVRWVMENTVGPASLAMTFVARNRDGGLMPAYARFIAVPGSNFLSNTWREPSEATPSRAVFRTGLGFLGRMASNAFEEFWPDVRDRFFSRPSSAGSSIQRTVTVN